MKEFIVNHHKAGQESDASKASRRRMLDSIADGTQMDRKHFERIFAALICSLRTIPRLHSPFMHRDSTENWVNIAYSRARLLKTQVRRSQVGFKMTKKLNGHTVMHRMISSAVQGQRSIFTRARRRFVRIEHLTVFVPQWQTCRYPKWRILSRHHTYEHLGLLILPCRHWCTTSVQ